VTQSRSSGPYHLRAPAGAYRPAHMARRVARHPRIPARARPALVVVTLLLGCLAFPDAARAQSGPAFASDDFDRTTLGAPWTVVDPAGDGMVSMEGAGTGDARLLLSVPANVAHEPFNTNGALRVMRSAEDTDFTAIVKFESVPTQKIQLQGILVEQDADDWLRFEVNSSGTSTKAYAASTVAGVTASQLNRSVTVGPAAYVRVTRSGDTWNLSTSGNGTSWTNAGTFNRALDVSSVGVMVGNANTTSSIPAYTAAVDYLFEASAPVDPEDGGTGTPAEYTLTTSASGPGSVTRSPDKPTYAPGEAVTLTAVPAAGATFTGWSGGVSGGQNPLVVTMDADKTVTASFTSESTPPVISAVSVDPDATSAVVTWATNEPASSSVSVGPTTGYELGAFGDAAQVTSHSVTITGLAPATTYHFRPSSTNAAGLTGTGADATFTTDAAPTVAFASDDFNRASLGAPWTVVDPRGDGTVSLSGDGTADARLRLAVPGGTSHDPWHTNNALHVLRPAADVDFTAEVKFDSRPTQKYQSQGLIVQQDAANWLRFNFHFNGSQLRAYAATTVNGSSTKRIDVATTGADRLWLQVQRASDSWTLRTSTDGSTWATAGSFSQAVDVTSLGPFAGNSGAPVPAFEALVDYVFEASAPLDPEDTPPVTASHTLMADVAGPGSITRQPAGPSYPAGSIVTLTAEPGPGAAFAGWSGDLTGGENPAELTMDADKSVTATFVADTTPPVISAVTTVPGSTSAVVTWATDEPASSSVAVGVTPSLELGSFGSSNLTRDHSVTVTGLSPGTTYLYRVASTNSAGLTATTATSSFSTPASAGPSITPFYGNNQVVGANGQPQNWYSVLGNVSDPDGVAALSYTLNGGTPRNLTIGPDGRRVYGPGDFNADIAWSSLQPGNNTVQLTGRDALGDVTTATVTLQRQDGTAPLPYTTDWASAARINDQAQVVDGKWTIDGATIRPAELGYDRLVMLGDISWDDYEVTFPVTVHNLGPGSGAQFSGPALVGFALNWRGHTAVGSEQPARYWYPTGALGWYRWYSPTPKFELRGNDDSPIARHNRFALNFGTTYMFKARSDSVAGGVQYSWKVWPQGSAEPSAWDLTLLETDGPATGSFGVIAHHVNAQFGNVTVTAIP
jgi:regulation of enolase protein 1 (concanavalin A-like superfamily)